KRLRVRAVYAAVTEQAEAAAVELGGEAAQGVLTLLDRPQLRGVLLLEQAWYTGVAARFACERGKPVYLARPFAESPMTLRDLHRRAVEQGISIVPELPLRYSPATMRLRELMATRLGRPVAIE